MSIPAALDDAAREVGSRRLWLLRRAIQTIALKAPARWWDLEIGDVLPFAHFSVPKPRDEGAQVKRWKREWLYVTKITEHWDDFEATIRGLLLREYICTLWDPMISEEPPNLGQGIARLDQGSATAVTRAFTRGSLSWCENAAANIASKQIVELANNEEEFSSDGEVRQGASTSYITRPAFVSGLTGWTTVAGTPTTDTSDLLFASSITAQSIRLDGAGPDSISIGTGAIAEQIVRISAYMRGDAGSSGLIWNFQRSSDAFYWRESDSTWVVAAPDNTWPAVSNQVPERVYSKQIDLGGVGLTSTFYVRAAPVATDVNHLYHVQIEGERWATGPMVSDNATFTRSAAVLTTKNDHGARTWGRPPFTVLIRFKPFWSTADLAASDLRRILLTLFDASNFYSLEYNQATTQWRFGVAAAGVTTRATFTRTVVARTEYALAARACSAEAEEDLAAYTISIFENGVKGTDANPGRETIMTSNPLIYYGANATGVQIANGWLSKLVIFPDAMSDSEIADLSA